MRWARPTTPMAEWPLNNSPRITALTARPVPGLPDCGSAARASHAHYAPAAATVAQPPASACIARTST